MRLFSVCYADIGLLWGNGRFFSHAAAEAWLLNNLPDCDHLAVRELSWLEREDSMLKSGAYQKVCWHAEPWIKSELEHYLHVSNDDPSMVAFTPDEKYGEADRQVRMKPGKYLTQFYSDVLSASEIQKMAEWYRTGHRPSMLNDLTLKFTTTPEEAEWVYTHGPSSCMSSALAFKVHPARVYATETAAVAYVERNDKVIARAVVNPLRKKFGRVYPTAGNWERDKFGSWEASEGVRQEFMNLLRKAGYSHSPSAMDNAELLMHQLPNRSSVYAMPYIDGDYYVEVNDDGDRFVLRYDLDDKYNCFCHETSGMIDVHDCDGCVSRAAEYEYEYECERCEEMIEDEFVEVVVVVGGSGTYARTTQRWCIHCAENHTFFCDALHMDVDDELMSTALADGRVVNSTYFDASCFVSDYNGEAYDNDDLCEVTDEHGDQVRWTQDQFDRHGFACALQSLSQNHQTDGRYTEDAKSERYGDDFSNSLDDLDQAEFEWIVNKLDPDNQLGLVYIPPRCEATADLFEPVGVAA